MAVLDLSSLSVRKEATALIVVLPTDSQYQITEKTAGMSVVDSRALVRSFVALVVLAVCWGAAATSMSARYLDAVAYTAVYQFGLYHLSRRHQNLQYHPYPRHLRLGRPPRHVGHRCNFPRRCVVIPVSTVVMACAMVRLSLVPSLASLLKLFCFV